MAHQVKVTATGKILLSDVSQSNVGRLLVHIPASSTITMTFVGRPITDGTNQALVASDDVTLSYYTPASDTLAAAAYSTSPGQVHVKADGNLVYANVSAITGTVWLTVVPLNG